MQYLKTQIRGGQLFQLRAVFQHKDRPDGGKNSTRSSRISRSARDKDLSNRYAQLISQNNQVSNITIDKNPIIFILFIVFIGIVRSSYCQRGILRDS